MTWSDEVRKCKKWSDNFREKQRYWERPYRSFVLYGISNSSSWPCKSGRSLYFAQMSSLLFHIAYMRTCVKISLRHVPQLSFCKFRIWNTEKALASMATLIARSKFESVSHRLLHIQHCNLFKLGIKIHFDKVHF